ncbi:MAG: hypothetical protein VX100_18960 [Pseudomonadota bacterium]|uniref:CHAT domain-containing protein n=1 Tax=Pseudoalteromonas spongiae TaxID=298657 RepID=A0ABU8EUU2_9GAMM|nr:hypothetical protein [Pseudomonadota bacterium]
MPNFVLLSVDTGMDVHTKPFELKRSEYYQSVSDGPSVRMLDSSFANKAALYESLQDASNCHTITFSSHGSPGIVHDNWDSPNGILLSLNDSPEYLQLLADNRFLYFMCCETASLDFTHQLLAYGARGVIGFNEKPKWHYHVIRRMWLDFDIGILQLLLYRQGLDKVKTHRDQYLNMIDSVLPVLIDAGETNRANDYKRMRSVLESMTIAQ